MQSQSQIEEKPAPSSFEIILNAARTQDADAIHKELKKVAIDVGKMGTCPVTQLAKEGNFDAVNFLIGKFNASKSKALLGYCKGGFEKEAQQIFATAKNEGERLGFYQMMLIGSAMANKNVAKIKKIEASFQNAFENTTTFKVSKVFGFAAGNHVKKVNSSIQTITDAKLRFNLVVGAVRGYAHQGNLEEISKWLLKYKNSDKLITLIQYAVSTLAVSGRFDQAQELILRYQHLDQEFILLNNLIAGSALGGHYQKALQILLENEDDDHFSLVTNLIYGLATSGYIENVSKELVKIPTPEQRQNIIKNVGGLFAGLGHQLAATNYFNTYKTLEMLQEIIMKTAATRNIEETEKFLAIGLARFPEEKDVLMALAIHGYVDGNFFSEAQRLCKTGKTEEERVELFEKYAVACAKNDYYFEALYTINQIPNKKLRFNIFKEIAIVYVDTNNIANAMQLYEEVNATPKAQSWLLNYLIENIKVDYQNPHIIFNLLITIESTNERTIFANALNAEYELNYNIENLLNEAAEIINILKHFPMLEFKDLQPHIDKILELKTQHQISFSQALAWLIPEIHIWLTQGTNLAKTTKLTEDLIFNIASFISPVELNETDQLSQKLKHRFYLHGNSHSNPIKLKEEEKKPELHP